MGARVTVGVGLTVTVGVLVMVEVAVGVPVGGCTTIVYPETGRPVNEAGWPPLLALFPVRAVTASW